MKNLRTNLRVVLGWILGLVFPLGFLLSCSTVETGPSSIQIFYSNSSSTLFGVSPYTYTLKDVRPGQEVSFPIDIFGGDSDISIKIQSVWPEESWKSISPGPKEALGWFSPKTTISLLKGQKATVLVFFKVPKEVDLKDSWFYDIEILPLDSLGEVNFSYRVKILVIT